MLNSTDSLQGHVTRRIKAEARERINNMEDTLF